MTARPAAARRAVELSPKRVEEIRDLLARLTVQRRPEDPDLSALLDDSRWALVELLEDRDDLIRANGEAAEELASWTGAL